MSKKKKNKCLEYCANCKYWYLYDDDDFKKYGECADGECRRFPPSVPIISRISDTGIAVPEDLIKGTLMVNHPFVFAGDWCGEFKEMKNPRWVEE